MQFSVINYLLGMNWNVKNQLDRCATLRNNEAPEISHPRFARSGRDSVAIKSALFGHHCRDASSHQLAF